MARKKGDDGAPNYTDFLPEAQAISEQRHSPLASILIMLIVGFFLVIVIWAALAEVDQAVVAPGYQEATNSAAHYGSVKLRVPG